MRIGFAAFGNMTKLQEHGLLKLIGNGCGIAGSRSDMGDASRDRSTYHFLNEGQFDAHPTGWPDNLQPREDYIIYDGTIKKSDEPIVAGIKSFHLTPEQHDKLVDPSNGLLARTTFSGDNLWWIKGTVIPVVRKRCRDLGRVFYCSISHKLDDLKIPQVTEIMRWGSLWGPSGKATGPIFTSSNDKDIP